MRRLLHILSLLVLVSAIPHIASAQETRTAILAGGCFWCVESDFDKLEGVISTVSGYTGGTIPNPTYENYHDEGALTPHIEAVEIKYDPEVISYDQIIAYHLRHIDPTDGGGQFCDRGAAYRPAIFVQNDRERQIAEDNLKQAAEQLGENLAVEVIQANKFWPAEDYHQNYYQKNPARYKFYRWRCGRDQRVEELWRH